MAISEGVSPRSAQPLEENKPYENRTVSDIPLRISLPSGKQVMLAMAISEDTGREGRGQRTLTPYHHYLHYLHYHFHI